MKSSIALFFLLFLTSNAYAKSLKDNWQNYMNAYPSAVKECANKVLSWGKSYTALTDIENCVRDKDEENLIKFGANSKEIQPMLQMTDTRYKEMFQIARETSVAIAVERNEERNKAALKRFLSIKQDISDRTFKTQEIILFNIK